MGDAARGADMQRAMGDIRIFAAKLIATIAGLILAVPVAVGIRHISDTFIDIVIGDLWGARASQVLFHPHFLKESRLDAICALLIPISIALWWPRPSPASKRIVACCLGSATAFMPAAAQIIVWPFIYHSLMACLPSLL
jgi:hypothetical protein